MEKFIVKKGIFEGKIFFGEILENRVLNNETIGQSYPIENCEKINDFKNIKRVEEIKNQLTKLKIKVNIDNIITQSLFSIGGTLNDKRNIYDCLSILESQIYNTPECVQSLEKAYFSKNYNLKKDTVFEDLKEYLQMKLDLENKKITPSSVIGRGYKEPRKCAFVWINKQIFRCYYLYCNFDLKNITE